MASGNISRRSSRSHVSPRGACVLESLEPRRLFSATVPIQLNQDVSGAIEPAGDTDRFTFTATQGQRVILDVKEVTGVYATLYLDFTLQAPGGTPIFTTTAYAGSPDRSDHDVVTLAAGQHTLVVDARGTDLSTYQFELVEAPPPQVASMTIGSVTSGAIETAGAEDLWNFTVAPGQRLYFDVQETTGDNSLYLDFTLLAPGGGQVFTTTAYANAPNNADFETAALAGGQYTLRADARGFNTSTYRFKFWDITNPDLAPVSVGGGPVSGGITGPGSSDAWTFTGAAGDKVLLDVQQVTGVYSTLYLDFTLLAPNGSELAKSTAYATQPDRADRGPITLPTSGQYRVRVDARGGDLSDYTFELCREVPALVSGLAWTPAFLGAVNAAGYGNGGYNVRALGDLHPMPWNNLNQVTVLFGAPTAVTQSSLQAHSIRGDDYEPVNFQYDASRNAAKWTLERPINNDRVLINTGTGQAAMLLVLPGDVARNANVNALDLGQVRARQLLSTVNPGSGGTTYTVFHDLNGNGSINALDLGIVRGNQLRALPDLPVNLVSPGLFSAISRIEDDGVTSLLD